MKYKWDRIQESNRIVHHYIDEQEYIKAEVGIRNKSFYVTFFYPTVRVAKRDFPTLKEAKAYAEHIIQASSQ